MRFEASAHLRAGGDLVVQHLQIQHFLTLLGVGGGDQHTAGHLTHHLAGRQVDDGHQGLAHQLFGLVPLGNTGLRMEP